MTDKDDKIIEQAKKHLEAARSAESENRQEMLDDLRFSALDQWPDSVKQDRRNRPMLVLDRVGQTVRKVIGDIRQSMPGIKISPVDSGSDVEVAQVFEGLIRQIQSQSRASLCFLNAAEDSVKMGFGVWRVITEFASDDVFEQDIKIKLIKNPFSVYFDPAAEESSKCDGRFVLVTEMVSKEQFEQQYGKIEEVSFDSNADGEYDHRWFDDDSIRIAEYFVKKPVKKTLVALSDGSTIDEAELDEETVSAYEAKGIAPVRERVVDSYEIKYYKLTGNKILEEKVWPGKLFPVVPVYGLEDQIDGRTDYRGVIRAAKDPQRLYNYWQSAAAETIALQPKAPYLVTGKQISEYKKYWDRANLDNLPYLPYTPDPQAGGIPQRQSPPSLQSGLLQQAQFASQDVQSATGVYDASLGARSNETSGKAILARQSEAELGSSVFLYNLATAIEHTGKILVEMIPHFYDTRRVIKVLGEDDSTKDVLINNPMFGPDGETVVNDLTRGKYDVRVSIGPSYKTKRQEAANSMVELARVFPQLTQIAGDLIAKNLDWPGADQIAERLKKLLPPGVAEEDDNPEAQQMAQQQQAEAQKLQQMQFQAEMEKLRAEVENKDADTEKKLSEAEKNEIDNAVKIAEIGKEQDNQALQAQAMLEIIKTLQPATPVL